MQYVLKFVAGMALVAFVMLGWELGHRLTVPGPSVDLRVPAGASARSIAGLLQEQGVNVPTWAFVGAVHLGGLGHHLMPGHYQINPGDSLWGLLQKFKKGQFQVTRITVTEGMSFAEIRALVLAASDLRHDTTLWSDSRIIEALGEPSVSPEGWFAPDTYEVDPDSSDLAFYKRAHLEQVKRLKQAWEQRAPNLPYQSPYQALIMASLVEKETGHPQDRDKVAAVFVNRERLGMPLQTDPSVIYGLGSHYSGRLHKHDLQTDTPFNTYTRRGLPPTPIATPGKDALQAALHPAATQALFFVARGDGSSVFSDTLDAHNHAVNQFLRHASNH